MSLARKAAKGAIWNVGASIGARVIGLSGTIVITHFLAPEVMGEVTAAFILIQSASLATNMSLGNYYIAKGDGSREIAFHMTALSLILGAFAFLGVFLLAGWIAETFNMPGMTQYVPGMLVAGILNRIGALPMKVLVKDLQFRRVGLAAAAGELVYVVVSVGLAARGWGGQAMVIGNILQRTVTTGLFVTGVSWRDWMLPCRLRWSQTREMFRWGAPLSIGVIVSYAATNWDTILYSRYFGSKAMGLYNLAYKLATLPGEQIGEHAGAVIFPSLSKIKKLSGRKNALVRSVALTSLLVSPLAVGLATVSDSLVHGIFNEKWYGIASLTTILAALSMFRPISACIQAYWTTIDRTRLIMILQIASIVTLLLAIITCAPFGPEGVCAAIGVTFAIFTTIRISLCAYLDGVSARRLWSGFLPPVLACAPMAGAALGCHYGLVSLGIDIPLLSLIVEIAVGVIVYIPAAFFFAPAISHDFLSLLKQALSRGKRPQN